MKFDWRNNRDFLGGLFYIVTGGIAIWIARDYPFGSALRMGPGYFPTVLSGIKIQFGLALMATGLKHPEKLKGSNRTLRALIDLKGGCIACGIKTRPEQSRSIWQRRPMNSFSSDCRATMASRRNRRRPT